MKQHIPEIDITRGLFIILVTWVHVTFFIGARPLGEIFFNTTCLPEMPQFFYVVWVVSEQLAPAGFFLLLGVSLTLSRQRFDRYDQYLKHQLKRAAVIMFLDILIKPLWLLTPFEILNTCNNDNTAVFFIFGIYINLGISIICCALLQRIPSFYLLLLAVTGLIWAGLVDVFDDFFDDYQSLLASIFLLSGVNSGVKVAFNIVPWVSYSVLGLVYGRLLLANPQGDRYKELFFSGLVVVNVVLIRLLEVAPTEKFWFLSKYPPNMLLTGACIVFTLLVINLVRIILRYQSVLLSALEKIGSNSLFVYSIHFPIFILLGFAIKKIHGDYIENSWILHGIWMAGLYVIYKLILFKRLSDLFRPYKWLRIRSTKD